MNQEQWHELFAMEVGEKKPVGTMVALRCSPRSLGAIFKHTKDLDEPFVQFRCTGCGCYDTYSADTRSRAIEWVEQHAGCAR